MRVLRGGNHLLRLQQQARRVLSQQNKDARCAPFTSTSFRSKEQPKAAAADATTKPKGTPYSALTIGVPKEVFPLEKRVAASPESVARLLKPGFRAVNIEAGAGAASYFSDAAYEAVGATIVKEKDQVWKSDIVLKVRKIDCVIGNASLLDQQH